MNAPAIRPATIADLPAITGIYNDAILTTTATFDTEPKTIEEQRTWFEHHGARYAVLVAVSGGTVTGWASLSPWSDRCAYSDTAEISVYVDAAHRGRGIGRALAEATVAAGREAGLHTLLSRIAEGNEPSVRLTESLGFRQVGVMHEVGFKFGKRLDVYLMELLLGPEA